MPGDPSAPDSADVEANEKSGGPPVERFTHADLSCKIVRTDLGHWCGYVRRPEDVEPIRWTSDYDSKHDDTLDAEVDVWGGITYGPDEDGWVGFDDAHARAIVDHREADDERGAVRLETKRLAEQIQELREENQPVTDGGHVACVVCGRHYDRSEHDSCPHCKNADLGKFLADGGLDAETVLGTVDEGDGVETDGGTFVGQGRGDVTAAEIDQWIEFLSEADREHRDPPIGGIAPSVIAEEVASEHRHPSTIRRHLERDGRAEEFVGIGPNGERTSFVFKGEP
jgi:hypothetical protein